MTSGAEEAGERTLLRRVPVILRSWDGPNSRIGLEVDLSQMPWGPFDALGQRLSLLLPTDDEVPTFAGGPEDEVERALRYVEHAADRCGEFAQLGTEHRDLWLRSQQTWEWIRRYLTRLWIETEVEGGGSERDETGEAPAATRAPQVPDGADSPEQRTTPEAPRLPGAAGTLRVAAQALRATPLSTWRESVSAADPEGPTREEAVQTLLGLANLLGAGESAQREKSPTPSSPESEPVPEEPSDPDHVSFEFARGYDEGYQMGRRVGLALGARKEHRARRP